MEIIDPNLGVQGNATVTKRVAARLGEARPWPAEYVQSLLRLAPDVVELDGCCSARGRYIWPGVPTFSVAFTLDENLAVVDVELETNGQDMAPAELDCVRQGFAAALREMEGVHRRQAAIAARLAELGPFLAAEAIGRTQTILDLFPDDPDVAGIIERASLTLEDLSR